MKTGIKHIVIAMLCLALTVPQIAFAQAASQAPLVNQSSIQFIPQGGSTTFGFVIGGTTPRKLLIRVVGPGLSQLGVDQTMPNPRCSLHRSVARGSAQVYGNDDWEMQNPPPSGNIVLARAEASELPGLMASVGAFGPLSQNDSAMVVTLAPGNYSIVAESGNSSVGTSGRVIIEVYLVQ